MVRKTISWVLAITFVVLLVGVNPSPVRSGTGSGDVDPTGLDTGRRITSVIPDRDPRVVVQRDISKSDVIVNRWIQMFYLKLVLRDLGL